MLSTAQRGEGTLKDIILISGKAGNGKDTFANFFKETVDEVEILHFADTLKSRAASEEGVYDLIHQGFYKKAKGEKTPMLDVFKNFLLEEYRPNKKTKVWDGKKDSLGRRFLQLLGDACKEVFGETIFAKTTFEKIKKTKGKIFLVPDTRFPYEISHIKNKTKNDYRVITVRIERPNFDNKLGKNGKHFSEIALDDYKFDYKIYNDGTLEDFKKKVINFVMEVVG